MYNHLTVSKQMSNSKIELFELDRNTWNHLTVCKEWASAHLKCKQQNVFTNHISNIYVRRGFGIK